jgi:eukaryotic-like serine/threonine-protein kinase
VDHAAANLPAEQPGQVIDRYKLLQPIGEGGFGTVWMAEQREPVKRRVAVKVIKLGMDTKQVIARFEAERQALAMMDHPNIAKVLDAGTTSTGRPYFAMEYIRGVPILEYCDTETLDTKSRLGLFAQVCQAIQHAHQKGIIHRDIKPSNVLVTLHDGVPVAKVIDFGVAKATNTELTARTLFTEHHQMIGTPAYMSPEQAEMSGLDIDTRSDIYSLGVLLYELLTGTTPFTTKELASKGLAEMLRIIREVEPHKPSTRLSTLGDTASRTAQQRRVDIRKLGLILRGDLDWIVMKCLEKDRARRYETANGLAADIHRHLNDEPVVASPPSTSYKLRKFVKRNRAQVIAGGVVAAALILGIVGTSVGMAWAINEKSRADKEAARANASAVAEAEQRRVAEANEQRAIEEATKAERELARATEIKRLITDMLTNVSPEVAQGTDTTLLKGLLDDASKRLARGEITNELIAAELHQVVGDVYRSLGLYPQAEAHLPVALEIRKRVLGEEHPETLGSKDILATLYSRQGRYAEAETLRLETLEITKRVLGEEHPSTLVSMNNLATLYQNQGRYAEAEPLYQQTLEIRKRVLGEEHSETLVSMINLASLYGEQERYAEIEPMYLKTLGIHRRVHGVEHPITLHFMHNMATVYEGQGRYAEAEQLNSQTLEIRQRVLGAEHPDTLASMINLATLYASQGRNAQAEPLILKTLEIQTRVLGEENPDTLTSMRNLALLYANQGRYADAEPLYLKALEIHRRVLGEEHPGTLTIMNNLAFLYFRQGRNAEAEALNLQTLEIRRRVLGEEHSETLGLLTNLGLLYNSMERHEDAAAMFETSLPIKRRVLGMQHPWTGYAMQGLAEAYEALGRRDEALPLRRELLELRTASAEKSDADANTLNTAAWMLLTHDIEDLRDPARALEYALRASQAEEAAGGGNLWMYLDTLALTHHRTGDNAAAIKTQKRAISLIPEGVAESTRIKMEQRLREFETALAGRAASNTAGADQ